VEHVGRFFFAPDTRAVFSHVPWVLARATQTPPPPLVFSQQANRVRALPFLCRALDGRFIWTNKKPKFRVMMFRNVGMKKMQGQQASQNFGKR
jgi:hypothetical protein